MSPSVRALRMVAAAALAWTAAVTLTACSDPHEELQAWMDEQRRDARPRVSPLVPPRAPTICS